MAGLVYLRVGASESYFQPNRGGGRVSRMNSRKILSRSSGDYAESAVSRTFNHLEFSRPKKWQTHSSGDITRITT